MTKHQLTYGIIGNPLDHSLSPYMHNTAFKALNINATYELFPLEEDELETFFLNLRKEGSSIFGLNVTVPYKEKVIGYLDSLTAFAKRTQAANTVVVTEGRNLIGHNTDGPGFLAHLVELGFNIQGKRIAILGAGGTTRAILASLCLLPERPESIRVYNRTVDNVESLIRVLSQQIDLSIVEIAYSVDELNIELADLVINTTSVGMKEDDPCLIDPDLIHSDMLVYDVIYHPKETTLLKLAKEQGAKTANGLGMLFYQGVLAFQHWADIELDASTKEKMRKSLELGKVYE